MHKTIDCWFYTEEIAENVDSTEILASDVTVCILNGVASILAVLANGFVIVRYLRTRQHQPVCNSLFFLIAVFDFLQGIVPQPLFITVMMLKLHRNFQCSLHVVTRSIAITFSGFSFIMATIVLTTDRLLAIVYPIWHRFVMKEKYIISITFSLFVSWAVVAWVVGVHYHRNVTIIRPLILFLMLLGLIYTVIVYVKIYFVCWRAKSQDLRLNNVKTTNQNIKEQDLRRKKQENDNNESSDSKPDGENQGIYRYHYLHSSHKIISQQTDFN